ncbi:hypothetical protein nACB1_018 [Acinetobacter phage nACB1]|nr:hypothetical protein nACB1_018 [Acinetobacter phage nACB1]
MDKDDLIRAGLLGMPYAASEVSLSELTASKILSDNRRLEGMWDSMEHAKRQSEYNAKMLEEKRKQQEVENFKKAYVKIRTDNIVLDHQTAIEMTKMIFQEADTITYEDTQ